MKKNTILSVAFLFVLLSGIIFCSTLHTDIEPIEEAVEVIPAKEVEVVMEIVKEEPVVVTETEEEFTPHYILSDDVPLEADEVVVVILFTFVISNTAW